MHVELIERPAEPGCDPGAPLLRGELLRGWRPDFRRRGKSGRRHAVRRMVREQTPEASKIWFHSLGLRRLSGRPPPFQGLKVALHRSGFTWYWCRWVPVRSI